MTNEQRAHDIAVAFLNAYLVNIDAAELIKETTSMHDQLASFALGEVYENAYRNALTFLNN